MFVTFSKPELDFDKAIQLHREGKFAEAERIYRAVLGQNPNHADALHMLGLLAYQQNRHPDAILLIERALQLMPNSASAHSNLGEVYRSMGNLEKASEHLRRAIEMDPRLGAPHTNLAFTLVGQGKAREALPIALRGLQMGPNDPGAMAAVGIAYAELGQSAEAIHFLERAWQLNPREVAVASTLAFAYARMEMADKGYAILQQAMAKWPENQQLVLNMGAMLAQVERFPEAADWLQKALEMDPGSIITLEHMVSVNTSLKKFEEAVALAKRILAIKPDAVDTIATMGEALMNLGRFDETIEEMNKGLAIKPWFSLHQSLSNAYTRMGNPEKGLEEINKAIELSPDNAVLHFNKAIILLLMGRLQEAWVEYEWRWKHPRMVGRTRKFNVPEWQGEPLHGKRLFLHAEQGLGDTIFFGRYATQIAEQYGGKVIVWTQKTVADLVRTIPGVVEVIPEGSPLPAFDYHLAIMSLPRVFNTSLETIPNKIPYIKSDPAKREHWRQEFARRTSKFKVGLVWEGGAFQPENFLRSNSLAAYAPLADVPGVAFFGLQKGPAEAQANNPPAGMDFTNLGPFIQDFSDTAAILDNLDLLISIDTSVIHVAAALGKPVWMLLAWSPGQMWMFKREDSPWYPNMRIYRQPAFKDWATPVGRVKADLEKLIASQPKK